MPLCYILAVLIHWSLLIFSSVLLYFGAEWLVRGASGIATHFGVRPLILGLVVVGFGTSMPEVVVVSLGKRFRGAVDESTN